MNVTVGVRVGTDGLIDGVTVGLTESGALVGSGTKGVNEGLALGTIEGESVVFFFTPPLIWY